MLPHGQISRPDHARQHAARRAVLHAGRILETGLTYPCPEMQEGLRDPQDCATIGARPSLSAPIDTTLATPDNPTPVACKHGGAGRCPVGSERTLPVRLATVTGKERPPDL